MSGFAERALVELVLTGAVCGILGVQVVLRRLAFFTHTLGHVAFLGIVAATVAGAGITAGAAIAAAGGVAVMSRGGIAVRRGHQHSGILVSGALALGVVLISARQGFSKDLTAALVGSPLTVGNDDVAVTTGVTALVVAVLALGHKELVLAAFDPAAFQAFGYRARIVDAGLLALVAVTVVSAVPAVGATLPLALLIGPAAAALVWTRRIVPAMMLGGLLGALSAAAGLTVSLHYRIATAAGVVIICGAVFVVAAATGRLTRIRSSWLAATTGTGL